MHLIILLTRKIHLQWLWGGGCQTGKVFLFLLFCQYIDTIHSNCKSQVQILILEFATCGQLSKRLTGNKACAWKCEFSKPSKVESPRQLSKLAKNCSLELCRVSNQTPEICLQIPCCSCWRLLQMPSTSCAQPRKVCQLPSVQTSSLVTQGQHPLMVWCWGEGRRGMKPCHHQYSNGGLF